MHELEGEGADMPPSLLNNYRKLYRKTGDCIASSTISCYLRHACRAFISFFPSQDEYELLFDAILQETAPKEKARGQDCCRRATGARYNGESLVYSPATILLCFGTFPIGLKYNLAENPLRPSRRPLLFSAITRGSIDQ